MQTSIKSSKWFYRIAGAVLFLMVASALSNGLFDDGRSARLGARILIDDPRGFAAMLDGRAERPFAYRRLVPDILNAIDAMVPAATQDRIFAQRSAEGVPETQKYLASPLAASRVYFLRYYAELYLNVAFIFAGIVLAYRLGLGVGYSRPIAALAAIGLFFVAAYFGPEYIYDYPELACMLLLVWAAIRLDWYWLLPIVALGTYNKESFLFYLIALYPFLRNRASAKLAALRLASLMLVAGLVNLYVHARFRLNPGSVAEQHFGAQLHFLLYVFVPHGFRRIFGLVLPSQTNIVCIVLVAWFVWKGWPLLSRPQRWHAVLASAVNFPLYFLLGSPGELRALSMLYTPILFLMLANLDAWQRAAQPTLHPTGSPA